MYRIYFLIRHCVCGLLGLALLATGRVRRGMTKAHSGNVITSVYFHKPSKRLFSRCISWLIKNHYTFLSTEELARILYAAAPFPQRAVWISLDDAYREWIHDVVPVVSERKVPVALFVPSGIVEGDGRLPWLHNPDYPDRRLEVIAAFRDRGARECMTVEELKWVAGCPEVTIGGHTVTHAILTCCTENQLERETADCKKALESITGSPVVSFAYPAGQTDHRVDRYLRDCGFQLAFTTKPEAITPGTDPLHVPRVCIPDEIAFPEAICRMAGIWLPFADAFKMRLRGRWRSHT